MITDLTKEHPDKILWRFLLPLMISVIFQQFYNIADSMIAGKFAGESALGAVGASYPITIIYMAFAVGMNLGASVVISRLFGAEDKAGLRRAVSTAFISVLVLSVLLSVFGYFCSGAMMRWIHTPEDIMADGVLYLKIYVYGLSFLLFYNVCTGIFTALGDSKTPLYFLIGSSLGNIFLDYWFVAGLHWGVAGVAWATFIAQGISAVCSFLIFLRTLRRLDGKAETWFSKAEFSSMSRIALPSILQQSTVSIGMMLVQSVVNGFGTQILAGFSAGMRIESLCVVPMSAIGNALSSYAAQNIGAEKHERIPLGYRAANIMVAITAVILCLFLELDSADFAVSAGASGAVFAVMGAMIYAVIRGRGHIEDLSARQVVIMAAFSLYFGFTSEGVDNAAHVGGLICGFLLAVLLYHPSQRAG